MPGPVATDSANQPTVRPGSGTGPRPGAGTGAGAGAGAGAEKLQPALLALLWDMREVYADPTLQTAMKALLPAEGMALASRGSSINYLVELKGLVSPRQDVVFAKHGYPPNPEGVEKMKADADAAVLAGDGAVARLSNELHRLLGLVPIGRGASHNRLHPQIIASLERRALEVCKQGVERLLAANDVQTILTDVRRHGVLSPQEEEQLATALAKADEAFMRQLVKEKLQAVNFKKTKNQCIREYLARHPGRLGSEPSVWRNTWATEAIAVAQGQASCVDRLLQDGYVVLDDLLDSSLVAMASSEVAEMHQLSELVTSSDVCNRGAKAVFLNFRTEEERAYHRGALPGLAALAERLVGLPQAFAEQGQQKEQPQDDEGQRLLSTLRIDPSVMVSAYEAGVSYRRHLDSYGGDDNHRALTILAYLNDPSWEEASAGALRLFKDLAPTGQAVSREEIEAASRREGEFVDVLPLAGRVVVFLSRRVWHEVQPAKRNRYAMTLWVPATQQSV